MHSLISLLIDHFIVIFFIRLVTNIEDCLMIGLWLCGIWAISLLIAIISGYDWLRCPCQLSLLIELLLTIVTLVLTGLIGLIELIRLIWIILLSECSIVLKPGTFFGLDLVYEFSYCSVLSRWN